MITVQEVPTHEDQVVPMVDKEKIDFSKVIDNKEEDEENRNAEEPVPSHPRYEQIINDNCEIKEDTLKDMFSCSSSRCF